MSVVLKRLAHTPASMSDIPLLTPFTNEVDDEGTAGHEVVDDAWGTGFYIASDSIDREGSRCILNSIITTTIAFSWPE